MKGFVCLLSIWLFLSCSHNADPQFTLQGIYTGSFQRGSSRISEVQLTFTENQFSGKVTSPDTVNYNTTIPVICRGTFVVDQQTIDFQDECAYPANFDWTLILSQKWTFSAPDNLLILSRNNDRYVLKKQ